MAAAAFTPTFLYMIGGLIIWGVRFLAAYSFTAIACSRGWSENAVGGVGVIPLTVGGLTALSVFGCFALLARAWPRLGFRALDAEAEENTRFVHYIAATVAALSLLALLWETVPVFLVPVCR